MKSGETNNNGNIKRSIEVITKGNHRYIRKHYRGMKNGKKWNAYDDIGRYCSNDVLHWGNLSKRVQKQLIEQNPQLKQYFQYMTKSSNKSVKGSTETLSNNKNLVR